MGIEGDLGSMRQKKKRRNALCTNTASADFHGDEKITRNLGYLCTEITAERSRGQTNWLAKVGQRRVLLGILGSQFRQFGDLEAFRRNEQ